MDNENREDGTEVDVSAAAKFRQWMMRRVRNSPDPINQSLMDLEYYGEHYGVSGIVDWDDDLSDLDDLGTF